MRTAILHGEAYRMTVFLESLDLPLEGHEASFSTALNGQKSTEMHGALIKHATTGPGLCTVITNRKDFMIS